MFLGLDLGTGSVKALVLDEGGEVRGEGSAPYRVHAPSPGWAESDPQDWWIAAAEATRAATGPRGERIEAVGLSGQMHGVVLSDEAGSPVRPAITWADARAREQLEAYGRLDTGLRGRLGNPPWVGMAGPSLLWLRDNEPENYRAARWALQPKDWLRLRLTGEAASEPTDASATLLYDVEGDGWAFDVVEALGLRAELLASLKDPARVAGQLGREAADYFRLPAGTPVAAGAADTAAAVLGSGLRPGAVQLTVGTGGQIVALRDEPVAYPEGGVHLYRAATGHLWYSMAAVQNAGLALEWARGLLGASWPEVYEEAFSVPAGAEGVTFLPYLTGERTPHFDPDVRGAWSGMGLKHGRGHLMRAALEGVGFSLRQALEALEKTGLRAPELLLGGGGASYALYRQLLASVLRRPLRVLPDANVSATGAAILGGMAVGAYPSDLDAELPGAARDPAEEEVVEPAEDQEAYEEAYRRYEQSYPSHPE
ncbi:MAG: xylulokinase [Actinomycetota bacterium]|nr:xylulokinase [Actinomycetota bacterium]